MLEMSSACESCSTFNRRQVLGCFLVQGRRFEGEVGGGGGVMSAAMLSGVRLSVSVRVQGALRFSTSASRLWGWGGPFGSQPGPNKKAAWLLRL